MTGGNMVHLSDRRKCQHRVWGRQYRGSRPAIYGKDTAAVCVSNLQSSPGLRASEAGSANSETYVLAPAEEIRKRQCSRCRSARTPRPSASPQALHLSYVGGGGPAQVDFATADGSCIAR